MPILWREAMSVDGGLIDRDHQALIAIINEFADIAPSRATKDQLLSVLLKLENYTKRHFRREEEVQRFINFSACEAHRQEHVGLMTKLAQVRSELAATEENQLNVVHQHITEFLRHWLIDHVIKSDLSMKPFLSSSKQGPR